MKARRWLVGCGALLGAFVVCVLLLLILISRLVSGKHSVLRVNGPDPKLIAAAQSAQAQLPKFIKSLSNPPSGDRFAVMATFTTPYGNEYLWIKDPRYVKPKFVGTLDQVPVAASYKKGDEVTVDQSAVVDWLIQDTDGRRQGDFTSGAARP